MHLNGNIATIPNLIIKRDGQIVSFDESKITSALSRCFGAIHRTPEIPLDDLSRRVVSVVSARYDMPTVENVQDTVEIILQSVGEYQAAKAYILYRADHERLREERPIPADVRIAFDESARYFPTALQQFQFYDKYSRFDYTLGRRETWIETVNRATDYLVELSNGALDSGVYDQIHSGILEMRAMPSMRLLAMAGPAARRNNLAIYNCSYGPVDSLDMFVEGLIISMSGCGVGFSVERQYVENLPRVVRQRQQKPIQHTIEDSSEGWADSLRFGLELWFAGGDVSFDYSQIRPAGAPLKTKGGRASGPEPLRKMLQFVRSRILARQGSVLRPLDAHDIMCAIGNAAVAGGVRRTAMISLFDYDDHEMKHSKDGDFSRDNNQRWNANNSAVWPNGGPTQIEFARQFLEMAESGRGEPGIFNRENAQNSRPVRRKWAVFGGNPCVTGNTWVMTQEGARQVVDLESVAHSAMIDGELHQTTAAGFWQNGIKEVFKVETSEGYSLRATANHPILNHRGEWVKVMDLRPGDKIRLHNHRGIDWDGDGIFEEGWMLGSLVGDGTFNNDTSAKLCYWGEHRGFMLNQALAFLRKTVGHPSGHEGHEILERNTCEVSSTKLANLAADYGIYRGNKRLNPFVEQTSREFYQGFLRGFFDADGTVIGTQQKGVSVRLSQVDLGNLETVQRMLLRLGIASAIYKNRTDAGYKLLPDGRGGEKDYYCQPLHELVIANDNLFVFAEIVGFSKPDKKERLETKLSAYKRTPNKEKFIATISTIVPDGIEAVYDCSVPGINAFDANGFYVHNCGEINLPPYSFCNLSNVPARSHDTLETLIEKVRLATIMGTIQSTATNFPGLRPIWRQNCEDERLLGVDITGQLDSPITQDAKVLAKLKQVAIETNQEFAARLGINQSAAITCVKPSGNSSVLLDTSPGIHARHAPYYIRNVRISTHSPLFQVMRDAGTPMDPDNGQTPEDATTWVVHFPVKSPDGAIVKRDLSAIAQCEIWLRNKINWTEHNPSATITYKPDEIIDLMAWVWEHREKIGGLSFLPIDDAQYDQMPYVEITAEEYERLADAFPVVDFSKIWRYEESDLTEAAQELACVSGACNL